MWLNCLRPSFFKLFLVWSFLETSSFSNLSPLVWNAPPENPNFVGREDILHEVLNLFNKAPLKIAVINGPPGYGKTQTAKRYIYLNFAKYDAVWWFRANQYLKPQFERFALAIAPHLGLKIEKSIHTIGHEYLISMIKEGIRLKNLKCLIVFDDAQSYSEIEPYLLFSHDKTIHTLVTTRNGNFSTHPISIKPFRREDSLKYINLFLNDELSDTKNQLAEHMGDCPAALAIAIDYIKSYPGMDIMQYLESHKAQKLHFPSSFMASQKLDSYVDGYNKDLWAAIQMNMKELRQHSEEAYQFLCLLSLLYRDEISPNLIEKWIMAKGIKTNIMTLIGLVKQYSLIEVTDPKSSKEAHITMQELIQEIVSSLVSIDEKRQRINEAVTIFKKSFSGRKDEVVKAILKDNTPLLHTIKLSQEADKINYHSPDLASVRINLLNILIGYIRDFDKGKLIIEHLKSDLVNGIKFSKADNILYHTNLFIFFAVGSDFENATKIGKITLEFLSSEEEMYEEKIRLFSNLIQYCSLTGTLEEADKFVEAGEKLLPLSKALEHNCLYIYATSMYFIDCGELEKAIALMRKYQVLLDEQASYHPSMRFFTLNQLAEALLKKGEIKEATHVLSLSEQQGKVFYGDNDQNNFYGRLYVLKAVSLFREPQTLEKAKSLIEKGIQVFEKIYQGSNKHRNQAFAHLQLGKLFHQYQQYDQAKTHYLKSEAIFAKLLKSQKIDDVSELYEKLAILGIDMKDEILTHAYLKMQRETFGLDHFRTKDILVYMDERGLYVPM